MLEENYIGTIPAGTFVTLELVERLNQNKGFDAIKQEAENLLQNFIDKGC